MTKKDLVSRVASVLRSNNVRKKISIPKQVFHISDDEGNHKDFIVRKTNKEMLFNTDDIASIVEACLLVIEDAIKHGEEVYLHGFGTLGLHHRAARRTKIVGTEEWVDIDAKYVPKFVAGNNLKTAAKLYELSLSDFPDEEDNEDGELNGS